MTFFPSGSEFCLQTSGDGCSLVQHQAADHDEHCANKQWRPKTAQFSLGVPQPPSPREARPFHTANNVARDREKFAKPCPEARPIMSNVLLTLILFTSSLPSNICLKHLQWRPIGTTCLIIFWGRIQWNQIQTAFSNTGAFF